MPEIRALPAPARLRAKIALVLHYAARTSFDFAARTLSGR
jgi:hypothetical protein